MCGVWALIGQLGLSPEIIQQCLQALKARGPDDVRTLPIGNSVTLGFTRLAINGLTEAGMQPFEYPLNKQRYASTNNTTTTSEERTSYLICNGMYPSLRKFSCIFRGLT